MPPPSLHAIAREKNWMEFAVLLEAAMDHPDSHGLPDPGAVRAAVARIRRQLPSSLSIALKAMRHLREHHPEVLASRDATIGCAPVRLLARIDALSRPSAAALAPLVFAGTVRQIELRLLYEALRSGRRPNARLASAA